LKILIVDDDPTCRMLLSEFLRPYGICITAENGLEATKLFSCEFKRDKKFDLVCLDIMMPHKDGHKVLKEIRNIERDNKTLPFNAVKVVMTTSLDDLENIFQAFNEQCDAYVNKPLDRHEILETLDDLGLMVGHSLESWGDS